jgi:hypothetical protein
MKKLMLMIASLFLATSVASANPTQKMDMLSMSKADSSFLFNGKANVVALSGTEMKQTEGEWGWAGAGWSFAIYTVTHIHNWNARDAARETVIGFINPISFFDSGTPVYLGW